MQKDNEIRTLRAKHKQKEMILKRKQEEVRYRIHEVQTRFRYVRFRPLSQCFIQRLRFLSSPRKTTALNYMKHKIMSFS